ncbi:type II secretion system F family protein [Streptomyces sp. RB6PN25]|uniref:Type II secretion system F family protein n=1 Tax=Streptomyces humicola TaxID=2953240 RepID=A0ABT1Q390_9ACTN|nr:type II secretion system F family protein [Streptomyces humicola]MCQ4084392.1 type II secretion system F family protein [Streptomyces humicola]
MGLTLLTGLILGSATGGGLWLIVHGITRQHEPGESRNPPSRTARWRERLRCFGWRRASVVALVGLLAGMVTDWPVASVLAALAAGVLPKLVGPDRAARARTERLEAVAVWAEMLRDTLSAAAGLEQAILATAPLAPDALRPHTTALATRIERGEALGASLRLFGQEVGDPVVDVVAVALVMAAERQARKLADLLGSLAASTREQVAMRLKIDASRARVRTSVRVVTGTTLGMAAGLMVLNRPYLQPFSGLTGQLMLTVVGALFAAGFAWLARIAHIPDEPRILAPSALSAPSSQATSTGPVPPQVAAKTTEART